MKKSRKRPADKVVKQRPMKQPRTANVTIPPPLDATTSSSSDDDTLPHEGKAVVLAHGACDRCGTTCLHRDPAPPSPPPPQSPMEDDKRSVERVLSRVLRKWRRRPTAFLHWTKTMKRNWSKAITLLATHFFCMCETVMTGSGRKTLSATCLKPVYAVFSRQWHSDLASIDVVSHCDKVPMFSRFSRVHFRRALQVWCPRVQRAASNVFPQFLSLIEPHAWAEAHSIENVQWQQNTCDDIMLSLSGVKHMSPPVANIIIEYLTMQPVSIELVQRHFKVEDNSVVT